MTLFILVNHVRKLNERVAPLGTQHSRAGLIPTHVTNAFIAPIVCDPVATNECYQTLANVLLNVFQLFPT